MGAFKNILWWMTFIIAGIWGQMVFPGVDILAAGLVLSLQEKRIQQTIWLFLACIIIQEGSGSLAFGYSLLWYAGVFFLFFVGRWLFEAKNLLFILLLGLCLGLLHGGLALTLAALQNYKLQPEVLLREGSLQALIFPIAWGIAAMLRPHMATPDVSRI